jgi:molybdenum cofactor biosynthesis protein B
VLSNAAVFYPRLENKRMGYREHKQKSEATTRQLTCGVITASDTRTPENDTSGQLIREALSAAGHEVTHYQIVKDEPVQITKLVQGFAAACEVLIINGGTGIAQRDRTFEAVDALLEKRLPGFGELFRMLSYEEIGAAAMLSRATAGIYHNTLVFSVPGSSAAVKLALEKLIIAELEHMAWLMLGE